MPKRKTIFANGEYYHLFNRTINMEPVFNGKRINSRTISTLEFYRLQDPPVRYSYFASYGEEKREEIMSNMLRKPQIVEIHAYCLMPNHFHLLLRQKEEDGISKYLSLFQNSITKYVNFKNGREGHLFSGQFKAVRIETEEQLIHVQRYIHLNPYTSYIVKDFDELDNYQYSSLPEFIGKRKGFCSNYLLRSFKDTLSYRGFVFNQADYQRELDGIKHLALE